MKPWLNLSLMVGAAGQFCVALLNLRLVRLLGWQEELARMPLLLREVFQIHVWFISITLLIFSAFTWRFAEVLAAGADPLGRWLAVSMGLFWLIRATLQITHYSASHWRGLPGRTAAHVILLAAYSAPAGV